MKIAVIGGSGFIGTRLVDRLLQAEHEVKIIDKNPSVAFTGNYEWGDVRDLDSLRRALVDSEIVVNLAAEHRDDVTPISLYDEVNVNGAANVCKACAEANINSIIFTSSVAVYGFAPLGTDEEGEIRFFNDYGRTKFFAEQEYRRWLADDPKNRSLTIVRPTVVFGERNRGNVYNLIKQISSRFFVMIGSGRNVKSMAYVENVAAFLQHCLANEPGERLFNYVDKPDFDMNTLVWRVFELLGKRKSRVRIPYALGYATGRCFDAVAAITHKQLAISSIRIKKFCANTMFNAENPKKVGFVPPISLEDGLAKTIKFEFIDKIEDQLFYSE
jgi:nucleoside-diphosphate-sugar epimerase